MRQSYTNLFNQPLQQYEGGAVEQVPPFPRFLENDNGFKLTRLDFNKGQAPSGL